MGQEVKTQLRWDGRIVEGTALLETDHLVFRGGASVSLPFGEMWSVEADAGWLEIKSARGLMLIELGPKAEVWKEKIKNPKGLVEKLGVAPDKKVLILGKLDAGLVKELEGTGAKVAKSARGKDFDIVFVVANKKADLEQITKARVLMKADGGIWIVYPKGRTGADELTERDVLTGGRTRELTDNKQVKVDEELTAVRFVIPTHLRKNKA
jgi:hypothetical protein